MEKREQQIALLMDFENLVIGLENNEPDVERPFAMDDIIRFLEQHYGRVVYRKAFADWSNSKFRKYGQDLMRSGVEMQHVVRVGYNAKSTADTFLVLQAMDCVLHYPAIDMYVLVTGDADFLPLISRLKATGRKVVGLGTEGTIANTLIQNCDEYIYYGSDGLRLQAKTLLDKTPVINALRKILGSRDCSLPAL
ncbi:MAG: NYN domain-containing protein, partial [Lentisphaerae bacterium]|nr:NYN domain-containing protein [Lentisphaerota bacterium]